MFKTLSKLKDNSFYTELCSSKILQTFPGWKDTHFSFSLSNNPFIDKHGNEEIRSTCDTVSFNIHTYITIFGRYNGLGNEVQAFIYCKSALWLKLFFKKPCLHIISYTYINMFKYIYDYTYRHIHM